MVNSKILLCRILMSAAPEIGHKNISLQTEFFGVRVRTRDFKALREIGGGAGVARLVPYQRHSHHAKMDLEWGRTKTSQRTKSVGLGKLGTNTNQFTDRKERSTFSVSRSFLFLTYV